jgi:serine/threonine protein kinase
VTASADLYSLGCTLYFLLTGQPPFPTGTLVERVHTHRSQEPEDIFRLRPDAAAELVAICERMMSKRPQDHFQQVEELVEILGAWLDGRISKMLGMMSRRLSSRAAPSRADDDVELTLAPLDEERCVKHSPTKAAVPTAAAAVPAKLEKQLVKPPTKRAAAQQSVVAPLPKLVEQLSSLPVGSFSLLEQAASGATESPWYLRSSSVRFSGESSMPRWLWGVVGTEAAGMLILVLWIVTYSLLH